MSKYTFQVIYILGNIQYLDLNRWHCKYGKAEHYSKKINKLKVNIKTCHVTYGMSRNLNTEDFGISGLHVEQGLKVTILHFFYYYI